MRDRAVPQPQWLRKLTDHGLTKMRHLQAAILLLVCAAVGGRGDLAAVDPEVVFSDDFTEALGERWQIVQGAWELRERELVHPEALLHQEVAVLPDGSPVEADRRVAAVDDLPGVVDGLSDQLCTGLGARRPVAQPPGLGLRILEATVL